MKKLKLLLILFALLIVFVQRANAQSEPLSIVAVEYQTRDDIDFLFQNSTQVLEYLEGIEITTPTFLSLVTPEQKNAIQSKGYKIRVIEENADIERFVLLYNPQPDQSEKLRPFGEPIAIGSHYTLLKLPVGGEFTHEGEGARFFDIPFSKIISPPTLRTKTAEPIPTPTTSEKDGQYYKPLLIGGIVFIVIAIVIGVILWLKRRNQTPQF